ncbi:MAG TPA: hypothetical protein PK407_16055, partial [Verrucomicrobiota bacterium]|nr:hypothetical protein [Verrucomicrobiota bacterium]
SRVAAEVSRVDAAGDGLGRGGWEGTVDNYEPVTLSVERPLQAKYTPSLLHGLGQFGIDVLEQPV